MATKKYIDLADLTLFKQLNDSATAQAIATAEARSLHTVAIDGTTLKFYREEEPVGSSVPAYSITLPQQDLSNYLQKIANATAGTVVVTKADGTIEESSLTASAISAALATVSGLANVATSGAAADVSIADASGLFTSDNVEGALTELAQASSGGVASKTVYLQDSSAGQSDYAKVYNLYQGANASDMSQNTLVGTINIPKDLVVQSGSVVVDPAGQPAGTYIELVIQNQAQPLYINVADLVDDYTAQQNATQVQLAISATNEISAAIVAGSIGTTELADDSVTASKVSIAQHTEENQEQNNDGLHVFVTTTDGQVSNVDAYIEQNTYEPYGASSSAIADLDATPSQSAGADGLALALVEEDGIITSISGSIASGTYDAYGAASAVQSAVTGTASDTKTDLTLNGLRAYVESVETAAETTEAVPEADIRALFSQASV